MPETNTNQATTWRGGVVVAALALVLGLLLALGAMFYLTPGQTVQYKTQYVLWKCGLAEDPEPWEELGGPGDIPPFETNLSHGPVTSEENEPTSEIDDIEVIPFAPDPFIAE
ncbi:MAG: hypothetical protein COA78_37365 [Blastopirellula sp.]|nr:MAG: hypothetical protein COA78_37365 [Blastopirellula sp.]